MNRMAIRLEKEGPITILRMISRFLGVSLFKVYAFFIDGLLIDTGFIHGQDKFLKICDRLHPDIVVNTHHHEDHTGNNFWVREKYGLLPLAHPKTATYMKAPFQWMPFYRRITWGCPLPSEMGELDSEIQTSRFRFVVIPTPGHADDHICLYEPNEGWLFSGDLFISEQVRYLREDEDIYLTIYSLKKIAALQPKRMFCSFSGIIDRPKEAIHLKMDYLENLKNGIEKGLQQGLAPHEIRRKLLGGGDRFRFVTGGQISKQNLINAFLKNPPSPQRGEGWGEGERG
jgi:glyoxylase-like metal-dependent hydrolase (beta-lactamase superfamily II)